MTASALSAAWTASSSFFLPDVLTPSRQQDDRAARFFRSRAENLVRRYPDRVPDRGRTCDRSDCRPRSAVCPVRPRRRRYNLKAARTCTRSIARRRRVTLFVIPCSSVDSPVNEMIETSSFDGRMTDSTNEIAAAFSSGSVRSCEALVSIRMARLSGRSICRENALISCGWPSSKILMSSCFKIGQQTAVLVLRRKKNVDDLGIDLDDLVVLRSEASAVGLAPFCCRVADASCAPHARKRQRRAKRANRRSRKPNSSN